MRPDPRLRPPPNRCARPWVDDLLGRVELAPERQVHESGFDGSWLVLEVDAVVTGCQGVDGSTPPADCATKGTHTRWFAHLDPARRWQVVASGTGAGCTEVRAAVPEFPRALCRRSPHGVALGPVAGTAPAAGSG